MNQLIDVNSSSFLTPNWLRVFRVVTGNGLNVICVATILIGSSQSSSIVGSLRGIIYFFQSKNEIKMEATCLRIDYLDVVYEWGSKFIHKDM